MQALLFIPDISGFTKFVNETEIEHSQHILHDLLEVILDVNQLNLAVSEIEGDAVFFYKTGQFPKLGDMLQQIETMFIGFHRYIKEIERDRLCDCGACSTAVNLTLKFVIHSGDVNISQIKKHTKLMGKDVIIAHRLLKNSIDNNEYILLTKQYMNSVSATDTQQTADWAEQAKGSDTYEHLGTIDYTYIRLSDLKSRIPELPVFEKRGKRSKRPVIITERIKAPLALIYNTLIDLGKRPQWTHGLKNIIYDKNEIPRVGSKHICHVPFGELELETVQRKKQKGLLEYAERATNIKVVENPTTFYILKENDGETTVSVEFHYRPRPVLGWLIDLYFRPSIRKSLIFSMNNFKSLCEQLFNSSLKKQ